MQGRGLVFVLALMAIAARGSAQTAMFPAVPPAPIPPALAPPPAASMGFLASLGMLCKAKTAWCCQSPIGKLLTNAKKPLNLMTGGMLPSCCESTVAAGQLAAPGAVGAAAKIKAEEAAAQARREAVKFLGTVDCHYYPEAEITLIMSLRADRNECVRWEAAKALSNGCCCTKNVVEALTITVSGSEKDGNPSENSPRVRAMAAAALQNCLAFHYHPTPLPPEVPQRPEQPVLDQQSRAGGVQLTAYYTQIAGKPMGQAISEAQRALAAAMSPASPAASAATPTGQRNLLTLWQRAGLDENQSTVDAIAGVEPIPDPLAADVPMPTPAFAPPPPAHLLQPGGVSPAWPVQGQPMQPAPSIMTPGSPSPVRPADFRPFVDRAPITQIPPPPHWPGHP
jgi:hypothetical protein